MHAQRDGLHCFASCHAFPRLFICVGRPSSAPPVRDELDPDDDDDLDMLKGALYKRKDFLGIEEEGTTCPLSFTRGWGDNRCTVA